MLPHVWPPPLHPDKLVLIFQAFFIEYCRLLGRMHGIGGRVLFVRGHAGTEVRWFLNFISSIQPYLIQKDMKPTAR